MMSPFSSPKRWRKENKENPYSNRGLDTFSALLSELDEKRQSIYSTRFDPDGPPLVRFVFKSSGECVPVLIKTKKKKTLKRKEIEEDDFTVKTESKTEEEEEEEVIKKTESETEEKQSCCVIKENIKKISRPNRFLQVATILVLIFLVFFGRTVSIMCTCIVWYLFPMIKEQSINRGSTLRETTNKKNLNIENRESFNQTNASRPNCSSG